MSMATFIIWILLLLGAGIPIGLITAKKDIWIGWGILFYLIGYWQRYFLEKLFQ